MCGLRASSPLAVRGSGVSSRFSLSCVPSSCHLVVLAPRPACFVAPVVIALVPHACRHLPSPPHVLCSRHLCLSCVRSCPPPVFSCGFLSPLSPFLRRAGRGVLCLLALSLRLSSLVSFPLVPRGLLAPRWIALVVAASARAPSPPLVSHRVPFVASPRSSTSVGGAGVGSLFACLFLALFSVAVSPSCVRADGRAVVCLPRMTAGVGRCRLVLCLVCGVRVCIYELGACSCIMMGVERKRTRKDFDDDERDGFGWRVCCGWSGCFAPHGHRSRHGCRARPDLRPLSCCDELEHVSRRQVLRGTIEKKHGGGETETPSPPLA